MVLKGLVEDGFMRLADGRVLMAPHAIDSKGTAHAGVIPIHPNFRMFMLANRPGFPFLGAL